MRRPLGESGFSLMSVLFDLMVFVTVAGIVAATFQQVNRKETANRDKAFAAQKASQMLEELRAVSHSVGADGFGVLDRYDDGSSYKNVLTVIAGVTNPEDPLSGNKGGHYQRLVHVDTVANNPGARRVTVSVFTASNHSPLAQVTTILLPPWKNYPPTQVFDVYALEIENSPYGFTSWGSMGPVRAMMDNVIQDLQSRRPGLELRVHRITRMAYGRDPYYAPAVNSALTTTQSGALPSVYLYPGKIPQGGYYYDPSGISARIRLDGTVLTGTSRYSITDTYNHAVRYPDEERLYQQAVSATPAGQAPPEMSWRMLIEQMNQHPERFSNAVIINLHGEAFPLPAMRNYSDAAKSPSALPNVRVVTHPENIHYGATDDVYLRVYSYLTSGSTPASLQQIQIQFPGALLASGAFALEKLKGNGSTGYSWQTAQLVGSCPSDVTLPRFLWQQSGGATVLTLCDTELDTSYHSGSRTGLPNAAKIHGQPYIPSETKGNAAFLSGVTSGLGTMTESASSGAKNTARWRIRITGGVLSQDLHAIETWMGLTTDQAVPPPNFSRTYVWINTTVPVTEQYQFLGDPRHMPYLDVRQQEGFNWYFKSLTGPGSVYSKTEDGWANSPNTGLYEGRVLIDVPRYFQVIRSGLLKSHAIFTNAGGHAAWSYSHGGEIMGHNDGSQQMLKRPWAPNATASAVTQVSETDGFGTTNRQRLIARSDKSWLSLPWIGELYPDNAFEPAPGTGWKADGNLPVGAGNFYRAPYSDFSTALSISFLPMTILNKRGNSSFINGTADGDVTYFEQLQDAQSTADITSYGSRVRNTLNIQIRDQVDLARAAHLHSTDNNRPVEWGDYLGLRTEVSAHRSYYNYTPDATLSGAGSFKVRFGGDIAYYVPIGVYTSNQLMTTQTMTLALGLSLQTFLEAGEDGAAGRIPQIPRVSIDSPAPDADPVVTPTSLSIAWSSAWRRWDDQPYTPDVSSTFAETGSPLFNVKYSRDGGRTWNFVDGGQPASAGVLDATHAVTSPYSWVLDGSVQGSVLLRVEAYRDGTGPHYAYHHRNVILR
jgi:hypothetical protein